MAGIFCSVRFNLNIWVALTIGLLSLSTYFLSRKKKPVVLLVIIFALGAIQTMLWIKTHQEHSLLNHLPLKVRKISGQIQQAPEGRRYLLLKADTLWVGEKVFPFHRMVTFPFSDSVHTLYAADRVIIKKVVLRSIPERRNPGQWDWKRYLRQQGIAAQLEPTEETSVKIFRQNSFSFWRLVEESRNFLSQKINGLFADDVEGFIAAILLGKRGEMAPQIKEEFQNLGLAHVLAISGLHVGFVVVFIHILLLFTPLSFRWRYAVAVVLLGGYMFLTGAKPPVVRATLMVGLFTIGVLLERKSNSFNLLGTAGFISLLVNPMQLFSPGFQFSFAAVGSILFFYPRLSSRTFPLTSRLPAGKIRLFLQKAILDPLWVSLAAQLGTWPLIAWYFHKISILSLLLNLLVIPLVGLILALAGIALLTSFFSYSSGLLLASLANLSCRGLFGLVEFFSKTPFSYFELGRFSPGWIALYLSFILLILFWRKPGLRKIRNALAVSLVLWLIFLVRPENPQTNFLVLDVGQGQSILCESATGKTLMIDTGPAGRDGAVPRKLILPTLQYLGTRRVEKMIITHAHEDHFGGLSILQQVLAIDSVFIPWVFPPDENQLHLENLLKQWGQPFRRLRAGDILELDSRLRVYILSPLPRFSYLTGEAGGNLNNTSLVCLIRSGPLTALVTGDAEIPVEKALLQWGELLQSQVLIVGHHGSETSSNLLFLRAVDPDYALISVGKYNRYGHPARQILERLNRLGISVFRTDQMGAVWMKGDENGWSRVKWR
ncbi:MAG: DNA internalization-related competence protein ComEC/Rec2 [Calditrichia bacterium]